MNSSLPAPALRLRDFTSPAGRRFLCRSAPANDGLSASQLVALVGGVIVLHAILAWALMQVPAVREAIFEAAPIFVDLLPPQAARSEPPPPPAPSPAPKGRALPKLAPTLLSSDTALPAAPVIVAEPATELPALPVAPATLPAPSPPLAPPPKVIPPSGVQYLVAPPLEYPRASRRMGEAGTVLVHVYIDASGLPREVQISQSSGHTRLDDAAITAVRKARFKPYAENGHPTSGWAFIPLTFDLEK